MGKDTMVDIFARAGVQSIKENTYTKSQTDDAITQATLGLWDDRGNYDASTNVFPSTGGSGQDGAILKDDIWIISVAGTLGETIVGIGDTVRALVDTPQSASDWGIVLYSTIFDNIKTLPTPTGEDGYFLVSDIINCRGAYLSTDTNLFGIVGDYGIVYFKYMEIEGSPFLDILLCNYSTSVVYSGGIDVSNPETLILNAIAWGIPPYLTSLPDNLVYKTDGIVSKTDLPSDIVYNNINNTIINFIGDSITNDGNYITYIQDYLPSATTIYTNGYAGQSMQQNISPFGNIMSNSNDWQTADIYSWCGTTNDFNFNGNIGTFNDYIYATGLNTFYGAMREWVNWCYNKNPSANLILCSEPQRNNGLTAYDVNKRAESLEALSVDNSNVVSGYINIATGATKIRLGSFVSQSNIAVDQSFDGGIETLLFTPTASEFHIITNNASWTNAYYLNLVDSSDEQWDYKFESFGQYYYNDKNSETIKWRFRYFGVSDITKSITVKYYGRGLNKNVLVGFYDTNNNLITSVTSHFNDDIVIPDNITITKFKITILSDNSSDVYVRQGNTLFDFANAVRNIAEYEGLPYANVLEESNINLNNLSITTVDKLHPNVEGGARMGAVILNELKKIGFSS